jgi:hypothetical protein
VAVPTLTHLPHGAKLKTGFDGSRLFSFYLSSSPPLSAKDNPLGFRVPCHVDRVAKRSIKLQSGFLHSISEHILYF